MSDASRDGGTVDALAALDARSWAPLLRALRGVGSPSDALADALAPPTSALSSGVGRRTLCAVVAADRDLVARLRADATLPVAVHEALGPGTSDADAAQDAEGDEDAAGAADAAGPAAARSGDRARALRRSLDEERRRREGAEVRAAAAEERAATASSEAERMTALVAELERARDEAAGAVEQAAARAERRAAGRVTGLERELAAARADAEASRIELERARSELSELRAELRALRARDVVPAGPVDAAPDGPARPLPLPDGLVPDTTEAARWLAERASLLIVDGYNVVLTLQAGRPLEEQRRWLIGRLRPLVARPGARPVIVFDGAGVDGRMRDTGGVEVRFTARGVSADDEIVFMVAGTGRPVLVVTDDAELRDRVRAEGGDVVGTVHLLGIVGA